jgi:ribose-phosphate pyrophosphokinase
MTPVLLHGHASPGLAADLAQELGLPLGRCALERFPDGELAVEVLEPVRGREVLLVQALGSPVGEHLLELALLADAAHRSGATQVTAVVPYLGYARQDRRETGREPLGARVVAELMAAGRVDRVVLLDPHHRSVEGCFPQPVEHATCLPDLAAYLAPHLLPGTVLVSPDLGAVKRAETFARLLGLPVAVVGKQRLSGGEVQVHRVVGEVAGRPVLLVDDMISTGGTLAAAARAVLEAGALPRLTVAATHGLFVGSCDERLADLPFEKVVVSDSLPGAGPFRFPLERVRCAPALAKVVRRLFG